MSDSKKFFITSTIFMTIGLLLICSSIILSAFLGEILLYGYLSIASCVLSLVFFALGGYFLYRYDEVHNENEMPPRILPSLSVMVVFIIGEICLIYYFATSKFIDFSGSVSAMLITGIILELIAIFVSSVMFVSGIKEFLRHRNR